MYIHFDLPCDEQTQKRLHRLFRHKIEEWKRLGLVNRAVLTYHYIPPAPTNSLYVCLDIPEVGETTRPETQLSQAELKQIPISIMQTVNATCDDNQIKPRIANYKLEIEQGKKYVEEKGGVYYGGAPVEEIIHFASIGTEIAFEVLGRFEEDEQIWKSDEELSRGILSRLEDEMGTDYKWLDLALNFVCNPLQIHESLVLHPASRSNFGVRALIRRLHEE